MKNVREISNFCENDLNSTENNEFLASSKSSLAPSMLIRWRQTVVRSNPDTEGIFLVQGKQTVVNS